MGKRVLNKELIDQYEYISFDIFDTLVQRKVLNNEDIYSLTKKLYHTRYCDDINNYVENRTKIEKDLWAKTAVGKFTFDCIFSKIKEIYGIEIGERLASIEREIERNLIVRNESVIELYQYALCRKKVIITSDMYLSKEFLVDILHNLGINGYEKIYISGECCANKANGKIFDYISKDIKTKNILHIGDSIKGDYLMPKAKGWGAFLLQNKKYNYFNLHLCQNMEDKVLVGLAITSPYCISEYQKNIGFSILGPILLGYVNWIKKKVDKYHIEEVVFLARDGYIVKKAFDLLYGKNYETQYMYVSRKSAIIATSEENADINYILSLFKFRREETFKDILLRLGVEKNSIEKQLDFIVKRKEIYNGKYNEQFMPLILEIKTNMKKQKEFLRRYIDSIFTQKKIAVVDVGWHGTIQKCIEKNLDKECLIKGLYLGLEKDKTDNMEQFLTPNSFDANMIPFTRGVFETFFTAPHPSTEGYYDKGEKIYPVYSKCDMPIKMQKHIEEIHEGAMKFIKEYQQLSLEKMVNEEYLNEELLSDMFMNFCNNPQCADAIKFGKMIFNDTSNRKLIDYKKNDLSYNLKSFMQSDWKAGYAKVLFKANISYGKVLAKLNEFRKK